MTNTNSILLEESFKPLFGDWWSMIRPFFIQGGFDPIYEVLKKDSKRGKIIIPSSDKVFRCFTETPYHDLKLVICGLSPYHSMKNGKMIADGLLMGCSETNYLQPSLEQFYNGIERELFNGLTVTHVKNPDVSYLAKQGVLMLNAALTTEYMKAGNHFDLWNPFMKFLFEEILGPSGVPIVFLGKEAAKLEKYTMPFTWVFKLSHPASASYNATDWDSEGVFKSVNKILKERNNESINWFELPDSLEEENEEEDLGLPF